MSKKKAAKIPMVTFRVYRQGLAQNVTVSCAGLCFRLTGPRIDHGTEIAVFSVDVAELRRRLTQLVRRAKRLARPYPSL